MLNGWAGNVGYGEFGATDTMNLYETSDGGVSWVPFDNFTGPEPTGICGLQVINDTVMCAVGRVRGPAFFAKTTNYCRFNCFVNYLVKPGYHITLINTFLLQV